MEMISVRIVMVNTLAASVKTVETLDSCGTRLIVVRSVLIVSEISRWIQSGTSESAKFT